MVFLTNSRIPLVLLFIFLGVGRAIAQDPHQEIRATINHFFDGMRSGDSSLVRSTLAMESSLSSILWNSKDSLVITRESTEHFIKAVGTPHDIVWDERIYDLKILVDVPMATVWAPYKFFAGEKFSHCGVNVFILAQSKKGWKINSITDTRRKTDCP
jgi:hypothetical protein